MEIRIDITKLFSNAYAIGIKAAYGNNYSIEWGDGQFESFSGTGKPQRHSHKYECYPERQNYSVRIQASPNAIIGIFMRHAALIYDIPPVRLANIDVSQCTSLEQLALPQFSGIDNLNLHGNPKLRNLSLECHSIQMLDLTDNPRMEYLYLSLCRNLETLDISKCLSLKVLDIVGTYSLKRLYLNEQTTLNKVKLSSESRRHFDTNQLMNIAQRNKAYIEYF